MKTVLKIGSIGVLLFIMSACATLPREELAIYADSVSNTKTAGDLILDEVSAVISTSGATRQPSCERNSQGYRPCFRVEFALGDLNARVDEHPDIQIRRLSLVVLRTYSQILLDISEGRPAAVIEQRGQELSELTSLLTTLLSGTGVGFASLPISGAVEIAKRLAEAAIETGARRSVLILEPDIRSLISLMIDDTPALYKIYVSQFIGSVRQTSIALNRARINGNVAEQERLQRKLDNLRSPGGNAAKANLFEEALTDYVKLLDNTDKALVSLRKSITNEDAGLFRQSAEFIRRATETRLLLESITRDLRDLREEDR
ncbi:MAG: hypothetical protein AAGE89_05710 [Pseudomonadota bacterium]